MRHWFVNAAAPHVRCRRVSAAGRPIGKGRLSQAQQSLGSGGRAAPRAPERTDLRQTQTDPHLALNGQAGEGKPQWQMADVGIEPFNMVYQTIDPLSSDR